MEIKILRVFLAKDGLPYKDISRTVHFPIVGNGFQGANNTTQIKFYFSELGDSNTTWVAVSKLPNGRIGSKVLETYDDTELGEPYALLELDSFYTQYKGDVYISLQGYEGGVNVEYNSETELYEIHGTPTIQATGSIKFSNNYATQFVGSGEEENTDIQALMAALGLKANASDTFLRYTSALNAVTLGTLYEKFSFDAFLLNDGTQDYLMQFEEDNGDPSGVRLVNLSTLETWYALITSQLDLTDATSYLKTSTCLKHLTNQEYVDTNYVPYSGATQDVDLGNAWLKTDGLQIGDIYHTIDIVSNNLIIGTGLGDIDLQPYGKLLYNSKEIATQEYAVPRVTSTDTYDRAYIVKDDGSQDTLEITALEAETIALRNENGHLFAGLIPLNPNYNWSDFLNNECMPRKYIDDKISDAKTTLQTNINKAGHSLTISGGSTTDYTYTITLKDKNNNNISTITFDLPLESVVVSGAYDSDTQSIVLTLQDGSEISVPIGDLIDGLVSQSDFNDLSDTVTNNYNASVKYTDINVSGGYVTELGKSGISYPIAQNVDVTTIPKVVQSTTDLPGTNDGYLYLVLDNGYLYNYVSGSGWTQAYQYTSDLLTITEVTVEED